MDEERKAEESRLAPRIQPPSPRDSERRSVWHLGGLSLAQVGKRVWDQMDVHRDDVFGR